MSSMLQKDSTSLTNKATYLHNDSSLISSTPNTLDSVIPTTEVTETQCHRPLFDRECVNLESHQLIFFDKNANNIEQQHETLFTLEELRKIVNYTKFINNVDEVLQHIEQTKDTTTFLVCSGSLGQTIVPQIHDLNNIQSIYVYCQNKQYHKQWSEDYSKIKEVYTDLQLVLNDLNHDVEQYLQQEKAGIFSEIGRMNYTTNIWTFSWWNYLIFMLCHLYYPDGCRQTFLMTLRNYYHDRDREIRVLDEFESTYTPETAIRWYTRDTFLYRLVNKALRQKNMEVIFLFGFFIKDMYTQLKNEHENFKSNHLHNTIVSVYRGQIISLEEINMFPDITTFINNSFFSTSLDRSFTSFLLNTSSQRDDPLQSVLFEIELDVHLMSQPFGDISSLSAFSSENEILFMIGTKFKVIGSSYDDSTNVYVVKLKLENEPPIKQDNYFTGMTAKAILKACVNEILNNLYRPSFEELNKLFDKLNEIFLSENGWLDAAKYHCFAKFYIQHHVKHYPEYISGVLSNLEQALTIYQTYLNDTELNCAIDINHIYYEMGFVYRVYVKDNILANKYYDLGITCCIESLQTMINKNKRMDLYDTLIWNYQGKSSITDDETQRKIITLDGIQYREQQLKEMLGYLPSEHVGLISCIRNLADLQMSMDLVTEAIANYEKMIHIYLSQPEPDFYASHLLFSELCKICIEQKGDYSLALHYKQKELDCKVKYKAAMSNATELGVSLITSEMGNIYKELADIYVQLSQYEAAYENLMIAKQFYQDSNYYDKTEKSAIIEENIRNVGRFLSEDYRN